MWPRTEAMTTRLSPCRVGQQAVSVGRVPGQAEPGLGAEGTACRDRGRAAMAGVCSGAPGASALASRPSRGWSSHCTPAAWSTFRFNTALWLHEMAVPRAQAQDGEREGSGRRSPLVLGLRAHAHSHVTSSPADARDKAGRIPVPCA